MPEVSDVADPDVAVLSILDIDEVLSGSEVGVPPAPDVFDPGMLLVVDADAAALLGGDVPPPGVVVLGTSDVVMLLAGDAGGPDILVLADSDEITLLAKDVEG